MQTWDYRTEKLETSYGLFSGTDFDEAAFNARLKQLGAEGWELVSLQDITKVKGGSKFLIAVFKRPTGSRGTD